MLRKESACKQQSYEGNAQHAGSTTRKADKVDFLKENGADEVFIDNGSIAEDVQKAGKYNKVSSSALLY